MKKLLLIDNYDSFTYNIKQLILQCTLNQKCPLEIVIKTNNDPSLLNYTLHANDMIIIGPGPGSPKDTGYSIDVLKKYSQLKTLGICLGHQLLAELHGATVSKAQFPVHGKCSRIFHDNSSLYHRVPNGVKVARYHSLSIKQQNLPPHVKATSESDDGEIMSIHIKNTNRYGVQFHPESFLTACGQQVLTNFLEMETTF